MKNKKLLCTGLIASLIAFATGCSSQKKDNYTPNQKVALTSEKTDTGEAKMSPFVVISFKKGSSVLSESNKAKIAKLTNDAKKDGEIDEIKVLAWADKDYPVAGQNAQRNDIQLADRRADMIKDYIEDSLNPDADVDSHNMAKRPMLLSKYLKTDDYKIKSHIENNPEAKEFLDNRDSKAVIMVEYEN